MNHAPEQSTKNGREYWKCSCGGWERSFAPEQVPDASATRFSIVRSCREHAGQ